MKNNFKISINLDVSVVEISTSIKNPKFGREFQNEDLHFFYSGAIVNQNELLLNFSAVNFEEVVKGLYLRYGSKFSEKFEGEYSGFLYDKTKKELFVFSNLTGSWPIFYFNNQKKILIDSNIFNLVKDLKNQNIPYSLDQTAAYTLLSFISLLGNQTLVKEVRKLNSCEQLNINIEKQEFCVENIGEINNETTFKGTKLEALEGLDFYFAKAVKQNFEFDVESSSKHFALLSGGMDTRMNVFYAHKQGFNLDKALCYNHSNYWDEKIAKKIAVDLGIALEIVHLDGGDYLKNIDPILDATYGLMDYTAGSQSHYSIPKSYNNDYGLVHGGLMGDGILGSYISDDTHEKPKLALPKLVSNDFFLPKIDSFVNQFLNEYQNKEMILIKNRGFNRLMCSCYITQNFSIQASPFLNKEFVMFALSLPNSWKKNHNLYIEWVNKYCPDATNYIWERTLLKPNATWKTKFGDNFTYRLFSQFYRKVLLKPQYTNMTPYSYYFKSNKTIETKFDQFFRELINVLDDFPELKMDVTNYYLTGNFGEKTKVLTLLKSYHKLFQ